MLLLACACSCPLFFYGTYNIPRKGWLTFLHCKLDSNSGPRLFFPFMCLIHYKGYCLTAVSIVCYYIAFILSLALASSSYYRPLAPSPILCILPLPSHSLFSYLLLRIVLFMEVRMEATRFMLTLLLAGSWRALEKCEIPPSSLPPSSSFCFPPSFLAVPFTLPSPYGRPPFLFFIPAHLTFF